MSDADRDPPPRPMEWRPAFTEVKPNRPANRFAGALARMGYDEFLVRAAAGGADAVISMSGVPCVAERSLARVAGVSRQAVNELARRYGLSTGTANARFISVAFAVRYAVAHDRTPPEEWLKHAGVTVDEIEQEFLRADLEEELLG